MVQFLTNLLAGIGGLCLLYALHSALDFCRLHFFLSSRPLTQYKATEPPSSAASKTSYTLVTGASAGIGLGTARCLVKNGFGVILLGHLEHELNDAAADLRKLRADAKVKTVVLDAIKATPADIAGLVADLEAQYLDVTILINNIGGLPITPPPMRELSTYSANDVDVVINMNARFMTQLTARMIAHLEKSAASLGSRALIINVSSAGKLGLPYSTLYAATKAYNFALSLSLSREFIFAGPGHKRQSRIDCLAIVPGDVLSQGNSKGVAANSPRWDEFGECLVRTADRAVGMGKTWISPWWLHDLQVRVVEWIPESVRTEESGKMIWAKKVAWDEHFAGEKKAS